MLAKGVSGVEVQSVVVKDIVTSSGASTTPGTLYVDLDPAGLSGAKRKSQLSVLLAFLALLPCCFAKVERVYSLRVRC